MYPGIEKKKQSADIRCDMIGDVDVESAQARGEERKAFVTGRERSVDHARSEREHAESSAHIRGVAYAKVSLLTSPLFKRLDSQ